MEAVLHRHTVYCVNRLGAAVSSSQQSDKWAFWGQGGVEHGKEGRQLFIRVSIR